MLTQQCSLTKFCGYTVHTKDFSIFFFHFCSSFILWSLYKCYVFNRNRISSVGRALTKEREVMGLIVGAGPILRVLKMTEK